MLVSSPYNKLTPSFLGCKKSNYRQTACFVMERYFYPKLDLSLFRIEKIKEAERMCFENNYLCKVTSQCFI